MTPAFSDTAIAASSAIASTSGLRGRKKRGVCQKQLDHQRMTEAELTVDAQTEETRSLVPDQSTIHAPLAHQCRQRAGAV